MCSNAQFNEVAKDQEVQEKVKFKKDVMEFYTSIIARTYDKGSRYTNLIIMAGYAVFFTFWSNVRSEVNIIDARVSVIYVVISVVFFIAWEIYEMIHSSSHLRKLYQLNQVPPDEFRAQMDQVIKEAKRLEARWASIWVYELILTIIPGFAGAILLIFSYIKTLLP